MQHYHIDSEVLGYKFMCGQSECVDRRCAHSHVCSNGCHTQVYSELQENHFQQKGHDIALSLTEEQKSYADHLWKWLLHVVESNSVLECSGDKVLANRLLAEVSVAAAGLP